MALVVVHEAPRPAEDGMIAAAIAAAWAAALGAPPAFLRLSAADAPPGAGPEHATADGALVANGLLWAERALGSLPGAADAVLGAVPPPDGPAVITVDPARFPGLSRADIERAVATLAPDATWIEVREEAGRFAAAAGGAPVGAWRRDRYGRPVAAAPVRLPGRFEAAPPAAAPTMHTGPRIVVVGEAAHHVAVCPAVCAAIGDAADAAGLAAPVDVVSPVGLDAAGLESLVGGAGALVLPGGNDLAQVEGQIATAAAALAAGTPVLGICLGMQSMTAAVARVRAGLAGAGLEEVAPGARPLVFSRLRDSGGTPAHRLGERTIRIAAGSRLAAAYGAERAVERLNHRYALVPELAPRLADAGLAVTATGESGVVDGVEAAGHPFFLGLQGHPELSSRPGRPHPLFAALLRAATEAVSPATAGVR